MVSVSHLSIVFTDSVEVTYCEPVCFIHGYQVSPPGACIGIDNGLCLF